MKPDAAWASPPSCGSPLVTVIDTAGVALTREAEEGGLSGEIARCIAELVTLEAPTLCLLGQGAGGGASPSSPPIE